MQIVAVQLEIQWEEKAANRRRVTELLGASQIQPGSLIVLPEMFETGFSMNVQRTAQDEDRQSEAFLRDLARQHDAAVLGGVVGPIVDGIASNEAVCFAPDGSELVRYRKMQPFTLSGEDGAYGSGESQQCFSWQGVKIAPFICYDLRFPEVFRPAAFSGAEMLVVIACWPQVRSEHWVRLLQARAIENLAIVIGVNRCGAEPNLTFDGRSCGFDEMGKPLFEADAQEQVICQEVNVENVRRWRSKFPALRDARSAACVES